MKKIKIILISLSLILSITKVYAANLDEITIIDDQNVNLLLSNDVILSQWNINAEIKFLKDIEITFVSKDFNDQNKLILNLASDMAINTSYNLLTIVWPDANIDFKTWVSLNDIEILNTENLDWKMQWLNRIIIKDSKTLELYFNAILEDEEFEFKLLNELIIEKITSIWNNNISLVLGDTIETISNYLIMILSIKDTTWNEIIFDEDLYELKTTQDLKSSSTEENNTVEEKDVVDVDLEEDETTLVGVALNSAETPDTWPETTVLLMLTFILNSIYFVRKKFKKA